MSAKTSEVPRKGDIRCGQALQTIATIKRLWGRITLRHNCMTHGWGAGNLTPGYRRQCGS